MVSSICVAPQGKFRVVVIDEKEKLHSIVEADYTDVDSDHPDLVEAQRRANEWDSNNLNATDCFCYIYNDKGEVCSRE